MPPCCTYIYIDQAQLHVYSPCSIYLFFLKKYCHGHGSIVWSRTSFTHNCKHVIRVRNLFFLSKNISHRPTAIVAPNCNSSCNCKCHPRLQICSVCRWGEGSSMSLGMQIASVVPKCSCMSTTTPKLWGVLPRRGRMHMCYYLRLGLLVLFIFCVKIWPYILTNKMSMLRILFVLFVSEMR